MQKILPLLLSFLPLLSAAEEICLNALETPDQASVYVSDETKSGELIGPPEGKFVCLDQAEDCIQIGDVGTPEVGFRVRKGFLLFKLPDLKGRKLTGATLQLYFSGFIRETPEKPLPPVWLFHASDWRDDSWDGNLLFKGLETVHFGDTENFKEKVPVCGQDDVAKKIIPIAVTKMIQKDYQRNATPVAAFRLQVSDQTQLDITDEQANLYAFWGPNMPQRVVEWVPMLVLSFE